MPGARLIYTLIFSACLILIEPGCTTIHDIPQKTNQIITGSKITKKSTKHYSSTTPNSVILLASNNIANKHYTTIADISINRYNMVGVKRQEAVLNDLMRKNAAFLGGNAIINIHKNHHKKSGQVIRFVS